MSLLFDSYNILNDHQSSRLFNGVLAASQIFGALAVLSVAFWASLDVEGGYAWNADPEKQFHYHPTFMTMGLIFLFGEAAIVYRVFRHEKKRFTKLLHIVIHSSALIFMVVSLKAVFDSHDYHKASDGTLAPIPNLYSLHSWIGILTVIGYVLQYAFGFITYFFPGLNMDIRKFSLPFHQFFGVILMIAVTGAALMGITERAAWKHTCWTKNGEFCAQQMVANFLGLTIVGYSTCILFIVLNPRWKRKPLPEEILNRNQRSAKSAVNPNSYANFMNLSLPKGMTLS